MFKEYKTLFKNLREAQEKLWSESTPWQPSSILPAELDQWQRSLFDNFSGMTRQAIDQSLDMQQAWLDQWAERAGSAKIKPKQFAGLSEEAQRSVGNWIEHQQGMWTQWLKLLQDSGAQLPTHGGMDRIFEQSLQQQMDTLQQWSKLDKPASLSVKQMNKLAEQIADAVTQSIETQQKLWGMWFDGLQQASEKIAVTAAPVTKKTAKPTAKPAKPATTTADDDLKLISGIGPGLETKLKERGYTTLAQIAKLTEAQIAELEKTVIRFPGRIKRDDWPGQARKLLSR